MDVQHLSTLQTRGTRLKFVFFWRDTGRTGCLSQWHTSPFTVAGITYPTAEHYMMAGKARLFGDEEMAAAILDAGHPAEAKKLGGRVRGFDEETWAAHRFGIVVDGNMAKFSQHPELRSYLLSTGDRVLVEASPLDRIWGIGLAADDERAERVADWRGLNLLGFALMEVRERLARE
ncbi:NADAR family protein [Actinomadura fibrosa]|uniref:NADAR family protein n=1 Tax=Actinomadura fibrosa TaxID=111802 RepID=A0ABW2XS38_9ACTN|nr:NADAR family protein [Actinomadura fibrosa]